MDTKKIQSQIPPLNITTQQTEQITTIKKVQGMEDLISELQRLQSHLDELRMESCFNKSKGLSDQLYNSLKKMKIGSVRKVCIICHCFYQRGEVIIQTPCRHIFHNRCIEPWLKKSITCPICRSNLKELLYLSKK